MGYICIGLTDHCHQSNRACYKANRGCSLMVVTDFCRRKYLTCTITRNFNFQLVPLGSMLFKRFAFQSMTTNLSLFCTGFSYSCKNPRCSNQKGDFSHRNRGSFRNGLLRFICQQCLVPPHSVCTKAAEAELLQPEEIQVWKSLLWIFSWFPWQQTREVLGFLQTSRGSISS